jgi:hypothetical protein
MDEQLFKVTKQDGYLRVDVWGQADVSTFSASTKAVLALREQSHINRLLCDIRELGSLKIDIAGQAQSIGTLWQIRDIEKVAFLIKKSHTADLLHGSLQATHFINKFQTFEDETAAIAWLQAS